MIPPVVVLADDQAAVRDRYRELLSSRCEVLETVADGQSALEAAARWLPDIVVMDISIPILNGVEACRRLRRTLPGTRVIMVSMHAGPAYVSGAILAGAAAFVLKTDAHSDLLAAVDAVLGNRLFISPAVRAEFWDDRTTGPERLQTITERQREVITFIGEGLSTKEIALAMGISFKTVVRRRRAAMRRLHISEPRALIRYAIRSRLPTT